MAEPDSGVNQQTATWQIVAWLKDLLRPHLPDIVKMAARLILDQCADPERDPLEFTRWCKVSGDDRRRMALIRQALRELV